MASNPIQDAIDKRLAEQGSKPAVVTTADTNSLRTTSKSGC